MHRAIALVEAGKTAYAAGREAGITPQALYQNPAYRKIIDARRASGVSVRGPYPRKNAEAKKRRPE